MATQLQLRQGGNVWGQPVAVLRTRTNPYDNDVSTAHTVKAMSHLARRYASDPHVVAATADALSGAMRSQREIASSIFYWIRANIRFVEDEQLMYEQLGIEPAQLDKELLVIPPVLLSMPEPMGDCDDFSLLMASMLLCAGIQPYFVTVAADAEDVNKFSHIYICACLRDEGTHMCLDAGNRLQMVPPGWESEKITRKAIWPV
jgi:transglutaminase-like putative cysteine protease